MAHEVESIAYVGDVPWHGIGVQLDKAPTPQKMLKVAHLDWSVSKRPLFTANSPNFSQEPCAVDLLLNDYFSLVRDSDNKVLGICGPQYQPFQNSEVFDFFKKFTDAGNMKMEVAGSLKGGLWVWALARIQGGAFELMGNDKNYTYLLLCSPHIWGEALTIMFTTIRVVCWNTLTQALNKAITGKFRAIHNRGFADVRGLAEISVEQAMINKAVYEQKAKLLSSAKVVDVTKLYEYIASLFQPALLESEAPVESTLFNKAATQVLFNYHTCPGSSMKSAKNTWWGAYNSVTYYFDHQVGRGNADTRLYDAWLSHKNAVTKRKAFESAIEYAQAG